MPVVLTWPVATSASTLPGLTGRPLSFLGKGLLSPLREDAVTGDFQLVADEANVKQCLRDGILTAIGERVMSEALGTITRDMLFEEQSVVSDLLAPSIKDFVNHFEPRVILQNVLVSMIDSNTEMVEFRVNVTYVVRVTNTRANLVFPFFLSSQNA